ncbi:hypothetical protein [Seonamhaeicola algicola]|uniref:hypothetical protein n=1 Tax=Seonamhaeicola algicola TaxID=1719036 RepID=UPI001FE41145|nr:hypothetical protein [Seonamhaeicola algicola]
MNTQSLSKPTYLLPIFHDLDTSAQAKKLIAVLGISNKTIGALLAQLITGFNCYTVFKIQYYTYLFTSQYNNKGSPLL